MPPKVKITKNDIINAAIDIIRNGCEDLNARSIAAALSCSTQPIFSNFNTMEELWGAVINEVYRIYLRFIDNEVKSEKYPRYKSFGVGYIRFAKEEKELFKLLFMRNRDNEELTYSKDFEESVEIIMKANGFSREKAELVHLEMWTCVHGIGTMLATSFVNLDWETISKITSDVYLGVIERAKNNGSN